MELFIYTLVVTHITIISVTLFLHRGQAHRAVTFHPAIEHFFRFWLWMTTGMVTKEWVAIHRRHHQCSDIEGDPHSPHVFGIWKVLFKGAGLYANASHDKKLITNYGVGTPDDWIERNVYSKYSTMGFTVLLFFNTMIFGPWGILVWAVQMLWIPFWAAGVVNGLGHWWGYRNGITKDHSQNLVPIGIIIGGEELHNNHHLSPGSAKLSKRWFEFDIGWFYIKLLESMRLATVKAHGIS